MIRKLAITAVATAFFLFPTPATAQSATDIDPKTHDEALEFLASLVRIDTSNPPGNETRAADYIKSILDREGIPSEIFKSAPGRGNLVARLKGNGSKKPLLLMGHLDVVGVVRDKWTVDPFAALIKNGYLYGRGAEDDKAMDAVNLVVFLKLHRDKVPLDRDVILLAEAGEEGTSQFGIDYMVDKHWDAIDCEYALNEGGRFHIENGKLQYAGVSSTEKVPRGMKLIAHGSSGHGSMPRTDNAITHLAAAVAKIGAWQPPMRLNETTREFFARLANISPPSDAYLYTHLDDPKVQEKLRATNIFYNSMLRTSIVPTIIQGGFRENVIPADAEATLDVRALPDENIEALMTTMRGMINDPQVELVRLINGQQRPAPSPSSIHSEMFQALERAQQKVFPGAITLPIMQTGATDSAQVRAKGVQAYGIGVPMDDDALRRVHGDDEHVSIDELGKFVDYLWTATVDIAATKSKP
jgi:acetylornithine deacetylase/succinyl-diaminopimelate desuccinylase-like protein